MNAVVLENALIDRLTAGFPRSDFQLNRLQECDAELVQLPGGTILAITTDSLVEEIETGIYADPHLIGWMTVIVNASDLAAAGAEPLGILLNQTFPTPADEAWTAGVQRGIDDACRACRLPVLGGDVNFSSRAAMGGTAIGIVNGDPPLTRTGCRAGDRLFASGVMGRGAAFAFVELSRAAGRDEAPTTAGGVGKQIVYRPEPRLAHGRLLRGLASAAIDTSDGFIPALDQLGRLNRVGFRIERPLEEYLDPESMLVAATAGLPQWMLLAGPHGEFELLFTVRQDNVDRFRSAAAAMNWTPLELGSVVDEPGIFLLDRLGTRLDIDGAAVRNLAFEAGADVTKYMAGLGALEAHGRAERKR